MPQTAAGTPAQRSMRYEAVFGRSSEPAAARREQLTAWLRGPDFVPPARYGDAEMCCCDDAPLRTRLELITRTVNWLRRHHPDRDEPLRLVSHCSGLLAWELALVLALTQEGWSRIELHVIDRIYPADLTTAHDAAPARHDAAPARHDAALLPLIRWIQSQAPACAFADRSDAAAEYAETHGVRGTLAYDGLRGLDELCRRRGLPRHIARLARSIWHDDDDAMRSDVLRDLFAFVRRRVACERQFFTARSRPTTETGGRDVDAARSIGAVASETAGFFTLIPHSSAAEARRNWALRRSAEADSRFDVDAFFLIDPGVNGIPLPVEGFEHLRRRYGAAGHLALSFEYGQQRVGRQITRHAEHAYARSRRAAGLGITPSE